MIDSEKKEIGKVFFNLYTVEIGWATLKWAKENRL